MFRYIFQYQYLQKYQFYRILICFISVYDISVFARICNLLNEFADKIYHNKQSYKQV